MGKENNKTFGTKLFSFESFLLTEQSMTNDLEETSVVVVCQFGKNWNLIFNSKQEKSFRKSE